MVRMVVLISGVMGTLLVSRYCDIVPVGNYAYADSATTMHRVYWWLWPSLWMAFGLSDLVARHDRGRLVVNAVGVFGLSLLIRVAALSPVAFLLTGSKSTLPTVVVRSHAWFERELVIIATSQTGSTATTALAWFAGSVTVVALGWLIQKLCRTDNPQTWLMIVAYSVALQFAAGLPTAFAVPAVAILTKILLIPVMDWYDRKQLHIQDPVSE